MKRISDWLDPGDGSERHKDLTGQRTENTGTWFIHSAQFQRWIKGDCDVLFCHGKGFFHQPPANGSWNRKVCPHVRFLRCLH